MNNGGLGLPPEKAQLLAENVVKQSQSGSVTDRYALALSHMDLEKSGGFEEGMKVATGLATVTQEVYEKMREPLEFATKAAEAPLKTSKITGSPFLRGFPRIGEVEGWD